MTESFVAATEDRTVADDRLSELLSRVWNEVITDVNRLLEVHNRFGTFHFKENLNPSLEDLIQGFEMVEFALKKLAESDHLEYEEMRRAINARQCILKMKELSLAMNSGDTTGVERVIGELRNQAKF